MKKKKVNKMFLFAYETEKGYWNTSRSFYESEEQFREAHNMNPWMRIIKLNISITIPEKTKEQLAFEAGLKAKEEKRQQYLNCIDDGDSFNPFDFED